MPFRLRKAPKRDAYWVVDDKGKHYSKNPMPKEAARRQQKALYAAANRGELRGGTLQQFLERLNLARQAYDAGNNTAAWDIIFTNPEDPEHQQFYEFFNNIALNSSADAWTDFGAWSNIAYEEIESFLQQQGFEVIPEAMEDPELGLPDEGVEEGTDPLSPTPPPPAPDEDPTGSGKKRKGKGVATASPPPPPPPHQRRKFKETTGHYAPQHQQQPKKQRGMADVMRETGRAHLIPPPIIIPPMDAFAFFGE